MPYAVEIGKLLLKKIQMDWKKNGCLTQVLQKLYAYVSEKDYIVCFLIRWYAQHTQHTQVLHKYNLVDVIYQTKAKELQSEHPSAKPSNTSEAHGHSVDNHD